MKLNHNQGLVPKNLKMKKKKIFLCSNANKLKFTIEASLHIHQSILQI